MKKLQIAIAIILILLAMFGCGKAVENPIENYNSRFGKFRFAKNDFGLQYFSGVDWSNCVKEGDYNQGTISIKCNYTNCGEYEYKINGDTVRLYKSFGDNVPLILKHTLVLDRKQRNVFGIFQK
jgi:hypothetical protein